MANRPSFPPYQSRPRGAPTSLAGIRVLDFSRVLAGPFCAQILADLGAEVIKVEEPEQGDQIRHVPPMIGDTSTYFMSLNRNKKSIVLDLANPDARQVALDLMGKVDVVIENYTTKVMKKYDLDYNSVGELYPQLIYCSVSGYGRTGPQADIPAYDSMIAAESGLMSFNAAPGERPIVSSVPIIDFMAAMNATIGILAALRARDNLGRGQFVDIAMYDSAMACLAYRGSDYLATGENPEPTGRISKTSAPGGEFDTADGPILAMITSDRMFKRLCEDVLERPDLVTDPRFETQALRHEYIKEVNAAVQAVLLKDIRRNWIAKMRKAQLPVGSMRTVAEAYHAEETLDRGIMGQIPHPGVGSVANISSVFRRLSLTPAIDPVAAPVLGAHTDGVLSDILRYNGEHVAALKERGVFGRAYQKVE